MSAGPYSPRLVQALARAQHVAVLTGAGISAESGIPTFRDPQAGLWSRFRPEELATRDAFARNPKLVWDWYEWRRGLIAHAAPNAAHRALVRMAERVPRVTIITQNVDGLHTDAGSPEVIELHGNIRRNKCFDPIEGQPHGACQPGPNPPDCAVCGGKLRPDVVWFGESLPVEVLTQAEAAARDCDLFFSIGTSALVYPAAGLPGAALKRSTMVVEINRESTALSAATPFSYRGAAGELLPKLLDLVWPP